MAHNLTKRGTVWYVTAQVNGKRISKSLNTGDKTIASTRARQIIQAAKGEKWEVLKQVESRTLSTMTIGDLLRLYRSTAAQHERETGKPRPATVDSYCWSLCHIVSVGSHAHDPLLAPISVLSPTLLESFVAQTVHMEGDHLASERDRRSAYSIIRSAKSVFSKWARPKLSGAGVPNVYDFLTCQAVDACKVRYHERPPELVERTVALARSTLRTTRPAFYAVFLLCHDLGMRASEAFNAKWSWIRETKKDDKVRRYMDIIVRPDYVPKGIEHAIPISSTIWEHLCAIRSSSLPWILPGDTVSEREDLIKRDFAAWMREIGWDARTYPKAAHELRKLIGSEWYTRFGAEVASNWLGHADITTTCRYYAALTRHPDPIEIE
jgi:integrase